jgi:hypothetical protein
MYLIGHPKTFAKIAWMSLIRPTSEALSKFTFGQVFHLMNPTIYNAAKGGGESSSLMTLKKMASAYFNQMGEKGVNGLMERGEKRYVDALKVYEDYKNSANPSKVKLEILKRNKDNAMLSSLGNLMYSFLGGSSVQDSWSAFVHRANYIEKQFGNISSEDFKDGNWLDKVNYVAGFVGRSHSAAKTFSGRASFAAGFMARVEDAINKGEDVHSNKVLEMAHESYLDWERGKYQQSNYISDKWNQVVNSISDRFHKQKEGWDKYDTGLKTFLKTEVAITRVPVNIIHEEVAEYLLGAFRAPVMAIKEFNKAKKQALSEQIEMPKGASEMVNSPEFKARVREIVSGMDADQAARIVRCFRKGGLGLGLYAAALIVGGIKFGIFPHMGQQKKKDESKLRKDELNPGQVMIGNDKLGDVASGMIEHTPALWDTFMGLGLVKIYSDDVHAVHHRKRKDALAAAADAIVTHLKIIESNIPQTKVISPTATVEEIGKSVKKSLVTWGLMSDKSKRSSGGNNDSSSGFSILNNSK